MSTTEAADRPRARLAMLALLGLLASCGGSTTAVEPDEAFRRIQVHEATIARQSAAADRCAPDSDCEAERALCDAVERLCEVSRSIDDPDATTRCERARRRCPETP